MSILSVIAVVAVVGYVIGRQLLGEPLRGKRLILLPLILAILGVVDLSHNAHHLHPADIAVIAVEACVAVAIGIAQGSMMRLERRNGTLWGQTPRRGIWLWVALVGSHIALDLVAVGVGAHVAAGTTPLLLTLGVNRLAQAAVVGSRALRSGIPFAPEKDGSTFMAGLFGSNASPFQAPRQTAPTRRRGRGPIADSLGDVIRGYLDTPRGHHDRDRSNAVTASSWDHWSSARQSK